jgi:hypothetical protein
MNRPQETPQERARDTETAATAPNSGNVSALSDLEYLTLIEVLNRAPITAGERYAINAIMIKLAPSPALPELAPGPEREPAVPSTVSPRTYPVNLPDSPAEPGQVP